MKIYSVCKRKWDYEIDDYLDVPYVFFSSLSKAWKFVSDQLEYTEWTSPRDAGVSWNTDDYDSIYEHEVDINYPSVLVYRWDSWVQTERYERQGPLKRTDTIKIKKPVRFSLTDS